MAEDTVYYVCEGIGNKWMVKEITRKEGDILKLASELSKKLTEEFSNSEYKSNLRDFKNLEKATKAAATTNTLFSLSNLFDAFVQRRGTFDGFFIAPKDSGIHPGDIVEKNSVKIEPIPAKKSASRIT